MFSLKDHFYGLVTRLIENWRNIGSTGRSKSFQKPNRSPGGRWSRLVTSARIIIGEEIAPRRSERWYACTGSARREKTIAATATIGNFFGHRSSLRPTVIGRADGVAAGMRRADWPGTRVRKSLAADFNACRTGWFIAMTLFSSPVTFSRRYDDAPRETLRVSAHRRFFETGNGRPCAAVLRHMDATWTEFRFLQLLDTNGILSANPTDSLIFSEKKKKKTAKYYFTNCRLKRIVNSGNAILTRCLTGAFIF